jgi:hypothetical protein
VRSASFGPFDDFVAQGGKTPKFGYGTLEFQDPAMVFLHLKLVTVLLDPPGGIGLQAIHLLSVVYEWQKAAVG